MTGADAGSGFAAADLPPLGDVVFTFSQETWSDAQRRGMARPPDRLVQTLMADPGVSRLLVANPYRSLLSVAKSLLTDRARLRELSFSPSADTRVATPFRMATADPTTDAGIRQTFAGYDSWIARTASSSGLRRPAIITFNPFVAGFCDLPWAGPVAYYARDDWAAYPPVRKWWPQYRRAYEEIARRGRTVVAVSRPILDRVGPTGPSAVIANGVDPEEWLSAAAEPPWLQPLPRPRVLYTGSLDDRLDPALLQQLSQSFAAGRLILLGPLLDPGHLADVVDAPNVHVHHATSRAEVVGTVLNVDVCILPHRDTELTAAMSPLKLFEYLAGGRRVVSTPLPGSQGIHPGVAFADSGEAFVAAVSDAIDAGPLDEADRRRFVAANSWRERHRTLYELLVAQR